MHILELQRLKIGFGYCAFETAYITNVKINEMKDSIVRINLI